MAENLLKNDWATLDSAELRLLLNEKIKGPGQYQDQINNPNQLYLPVAGPACRIVLTFRDKKIIGIEAGTAFDASEWKQIGDEVEKLINAQETIIGREFSFSSFRVTGSWRGQRSGVQILPPPDEAPRANLEIAEHPFILEFPIRDTGLWATTNHRRIRDHRKLTLLLNVLLAGRTCLEPRVPECFWASIPRNDGRYETEWVRRLFFADLGKPVRDELSPAGTEQLEEIEKDEYYKMTGHDGKALRVPSDLDKSICCYAGLSLMNRIKFDRATFWIDLASRVWNASMSASFAASVSAIESLTDRGDVHSFDCPTCHNPTQHEVPGSTRRFMDFFDTYAPGVAFTKRRQEMYSLRSKILHGNDLTDLDQDRAFGWDPPWWNERELYGELWSVTRIALRNWLQTV